MLDRLSHEFHCKTAFQMIGSGAVAATAFWIPVAPVAGVVFGAGLMSFWQALISERSQRRLIQKVTGVVVSAAGSAITFTYLRENKVAIIGSIAGLALGLFSTYNKALWRRCCKIEPQPMLDYLELVPVGSGGEAPPT